MHSRMCRFSHLSISSEATVHLATTALTAGAHNPQSRVRSGNVFFVTFVYCCVELIMCICGKSCLSHRES